MRFVEKPSLVVAVKRIRADELWNHFFCVLNLERASPLDGSVVTIELTEGRHRECVTSTVGLRTAT